MEMLERRTVCRTTTDIVSIEKLEHFVWFLPFIVTDNNCETVVFKSGNSLLPINQYMVQRRVLQRGLCRSKEKCLKPDLKCVNRWSMQFDSSEEAM